MFDEKKFPSHWGMPPLLQKSDWVNLPRGYGQGSSTLDAWIVKKMQEDEHMDELHLVISDPWLTWWVAHSVWLVFIGLTILLKRRSLQPGGYLYHYDKARIDKEVADRRRRLRDTLKDPVLVQHWEKKLEYTLGSVELAKAEMGTWRDTVKRWEQGEDDEHKEAVFYRKRGTIVVPSLALVKLFLILPMGFFAYFFPSKDAMRMYLVLVVAHIFDNWLIVRKYRGMKRRKPSSKDTKCDQVVAATGIPAAEPASIV